MDDEEFEKRLDIEKSFLNTSKNHTEELEKQLEEQKEEYKVRDEEEEIKEKINKHLISDDILTSSDSSFGVSSLPSIIIGIVTVAIVLSVGLIVLNELKSVVDEEQFTQTNVSGITSSIITTLPTWIGIIIIVALGFIAVSFLRVRD